MNDENVCYICLRISSSEIMKALLTMGFDSVFARKTLSELQTIIKQTYESNPFCLAGKSGKGIISGLVYCLTKGREKTISQQLIADAFNCTEVTVRKSFKFWYTILGDEFLPSKHKYHIILKQKAFSNKRFVKTALDAWGVQIEKCEHCDKIRYSYIDEKAVNIANASGNSYFYIIPIWIKELLNNEAPERTTPILKPKKSKREPSLFWRLW